MYKLRFFACMLISFTFPRSKTKPSFEFQNVLYKINQSDTVDVQQILSVV